MCTAAAATRTRMARAAAAPRLMPASGHAACVRRPWAMGSLLPQTRTSLPWLARSTAASVPGGGSDDDLTAGSAASNSSAEGAGDDIDSTGATHGSTDASAAERKAQQHGQPPVPAPAGEGASAGKGVEGAQGLGPETMRASLERLFASAEATEPMCAPGAEQPDTPSRGGIPVRWPSVDWSRYNLQLLFVDRSGTLRSRLAAAIFEQIAEWNGWSRVMVPWSCGLHTSVKVHTSEEFHTGVNRPVEPSGQGADPGVQGLGQGQQGQQEQQGQQGEDEDTAQRTGGSDEMSKRAAVLTAGSSLGLFPGSFTKPADRFDLEDLDFYDLVLVVDRGLYNEVLGRVPPEQREHYRKKVHLLTSFSEYESEGIVLATGGLALLPRALSGLLRPTFKESREVVDVPSPDLSSANSQEELSAVVRTLVLACAGLCKYLMDSFPEAASGGGPHKY